MKSDHDTHRKIQSNLSCFQWRFKALRQPAMLARTGQNGSQSGQALKTEGGRSCGPIPTMSRRNMASSIRKSWGWRSSANWSCRPGHCRRSGLAIQPPLLGGLFTHQGPILTVANWSGTWPGLVGLLNLNASLTKMGVRYSTLWSEDFRDAFFRDGLHQWLTMRVVTHDQSHVRHFDQ